MKITWTQPNSSSFPEAPVMQTGASFFPVPPSKGKNARCKVEENFLQRGAKFFAEIVRCHVEGQKSVRQRHDRPQIGFMTEP